MSDLGAELPDDGPPEKEVSFSLSLCFPWYRLKAVRPNAEPREAARCLKPTESCARSFMRSFNEPKECSLSSVSNNLTTCSGFGS